MTLHECVLKYVKWKQEIGYRFHRGESTLRKFSVGLSEVRMDEVSPEHVLHFLNKRTVAAVTWRHRYWLLNRFFKHWSDRGVIPELIMPTPRPAVRRSYTPYIFTTVELRLLLSLNTQNHDFRLGIHERTFRTIFLFLYATGATVGEISHILISDLNLADGFILIRSTRPNRARRIPIGSDLQALLSDYKAWRYETSHVSPYLFMTKKDRQICADKISLTFRRLRRLAGICRFDGSIYQPRIDDLRYTFAVHRITRWIEDGVDLNRMLPALAAYMGQVGLGSTERYLFLSPERFRKDLDKLSPSRGKGNWHRDPELMGFLASL